MTIINIDKLGHFEANVQVFQKTLTVHMQDQILTIQQAAAILGISTKTLRRWEERGILIPERTIGNQRRYTMSELVEFKKRGKIIDDAFVKTQPVQTDVAPPQSNTTYAPTPIPPSAAPTTHHIPVAETPKLTHFTPVASNIQTRARHLEAAMKRQFLIRPRLSSGMVIALIGFIIAASALPIAGHFKSGSGNQQNPQKNGEASVLQAKSASRSLFGDITFGIPTIFKDKVTIKSEFVVDGKSLFNDDIKVNNRNVDLGTGELTASNIVYQLIAGNNVTIGGDPQNPVISASVELPDLTGSTVTSLQGRTGSIAITEGTGISLNGLEIANTGVLSLGGETGEVTLTAGDGIVVSGTTITNDDPGSAQNIFKNIIVDTTTITAGSNDDTLTFEAGTGITIAPDAALKKFTISSSSTGFSGLTTNGVLYALSASTATTTTPGTTGTVLKGVTGDVPTFGAVSLTTDVAGVLPIANGGTGISTTPSNGQLLIGNGAGYALSTLNGTSNQITINNSPGSISISTPQDIHTGAMPTFASLHLTATANQIVLGAGNTATITTAVLNNPRTYTFPNLSGEVCLSSGNCSGAGGSITGSGTSNFIARFNSATGLGDSSIYDDGKVAIGTTSPQGLFNVFGGSAGRGLVVLNETGDQDILTGSASGTTQFVFDRSGNLTIAGNYEIGNVPVLTSTGLGGNVVSSSLTSVSTLASGAISAGFGAIDTGTDAISGGDLTGTGTTGLTLTGNGAGITLSGSGNHTISASGGVLQLGAVTLTGAVSGNGQNVTNVNNFSAAGTIQFSGFGIGVLQSNGSGQLSSTALNIGGGASYISGTLPTTNGGTGLNSYSTGDLIYASGANTLAARSIGTPGQVLTVVGGVPSWTDATGTINFWQTNGNALSPANSQNDLLLGANATDSAKFAFKNVAGGTPTASISAGTNGGVYLTATGTLATTTKQSLRLGDADTGNIVINGLSTGIVKSNASGVLSSSAVNLATADITGILGVSNGGTGANTAGGARTSLGAAASGANSDITSLSGLTTALSVGQGGTGTTSLALNGVLYGNNTGAINATVAGQNGELFLGQTGGAPAFQALGGDASINASGVLTIATNAVALGADTTGNYVANISGGSGIAISGSAGEGWTPTVALAALTSDWDQTGAFDIVLSNAGSELRILESSGGSFYGTLDVGDLSNNRTYTLPDSTGTICIAEAGNCAGSGTGVTTPGGTANRLARFNAAQAIENASINDLYTAGVAMTIDASGQIAIGTASPNAQLHINGISTGGNAAAIFNQAGSSSNDILAASASGVTKFVVNNNGNLQFTGNTGFFNTLTSAATQNRTYTLPNANGTICIVEAGNCAGSGGGLTGSGTIGQIAYFNGGGTVTSDTTGFAWDAANDRLGIGIDLPVAKLDLSGSVTGKALALFNETGNQDIFSASASGTTRLTLSNTGNLNLASGVYQIGGTSVLDSTTLGSNILNSSLQQVGTITTGVWQGTIIGAQYGGTGDNTSATTGVPYISSGNWQYESQLGTARGGTGADLSGAAHGAIPYINGTGSMSALAPGTAGYVLVTNGSGQNPQWVNGASLGTNAWNTIDGALSPVNANSMDLLLGATATDSAKFAFKNVSGGTPTASISAGLNGGIYITADGTIATTTRQALVLGTNTTGDIILNPNGNIGIGTTTPGNDKLAVTGNTRVSGEVRSGSGFYQSGATDTIIANDNNGSNIRFTTSTGEKMRITDAGYVGIGSTNPQSKFTISGASTGKALAVFDETGDQNILTGSASGVTRFIVDRSGNVNVLGGGYKLNGTTVVDASGNLSNIGTINSTYFNASSNTVNLAASTALQFNGFTVIDASRNLSNIAGVGVNLNPTVNNTYTLGASGNQYSSIYGQSIYQNGSQVCDSSGNCSGLTPTFWEEADGTLRAKNTTLDLLIGGSTSESAKFAIRNVVGNGTPTASVSAGTNGAAFLTADGTLQTTANQTLYLGGGSTGNIVLNSGAGGISLLDAVTLNGNFTQLNGTSFTTGTGQVTLNGNVDANNGLDVTGSALNVGGTNASISLAGAITGTELTIDSNLTLNNGTLAATTGDLTLSALDGNIVIANGVSLNAGGGGEASYNSFANGGETPEQAGIQDDNDLYIGGNLEVDGVIYQGDNQVCDTSNNCGGATNYLQINAGSLAPGNSATVTDRFVLGGNTTTVHQFEVNGKQTGKALVSLNETGNQNILTGSASGSTVFTFDRSGNLILTGDLQIGNIGLNDVGTNNVTSGGSLIGLYDEFLNSGSTNLQDVLDDFDAAIGGGASKWTLDGTVIYPATAGNKVGIGTTTAADVLSSFYVTRDQAQGALGKSLAILNQTENQDIFTASASGTTRFTIANNGNLTATGTLTGLTGLTASGAINFSGLTANRAIFTDGSSNLTGSGASSALLDALTDETGSGVAVFGTSPSFTTSILTGSASFDLLNTTATTLNIGGEATTITLGDTSGTVTIRNAEIDLANGVLQTGGIDRLSTAGVLSNITGYTQTQGAFSTTLTTTNTAMFSSTTTNADSIALAPNVTGSNTFTGTLTTADLTGNQTYTLPNATGIICVSGQTCAASGTVGYLTRTGVNLSPATATDTLSIGTTTPLATFDVRGLSGTTPIASFSGQTALAGMVVNNDGLGDIFTASKGGATKFTVLNSGDIQVNNLASCDSIDTDPNGRLVCGTDAGSGTAGIVNIQNNGTPIGSNINTVNFGTQFNVSADPSTQANIAIANDALNFSEFADSLSLDAATSIALNGFDLSIGTNAGNGGVLIAPNAGGNAALIINKQGTNDIFSASASGATRFTIANNGNVTISGGGDLTIGTTSLSETTSPTDSGAYLIGVNDEFANSNSTNLQAVLNDLDASIGAGSSKWQLTSNTLAPANLTHQVVLGGNTTTPFQFEVNGKQTGKALVSLDETGNQDILTGSASGATRFTFDRSGNLNLVGGSVAISGITVIDSARNLSSIGTIDSTYLDASGNVVNLAGSTSLQFNGTTVISSSLNLQNIAGVGTNLNPTVNNTYNLGTGALRYAEVHGQTLYQAGNQVCDTSNNCSGTTNYLQLNTNSIAPGNAANVADRFVLGGSTTTVHQFEVNGKQTGKALVSLNETGNQAILTGSASGTTQFTFDRSGNLAIDGALSDLNDTLLAINDDLDINGALAVGSSNQFNVTNAGLITTVTNETINGIDINAGEVSDVTNLSISGNFAIGSTDLDETTAANDSGAFLVGVFDEFTNSASTNVQDVLDDLDAAIGAGSSKWTTNSNVIYPTTIGTQVAVGGNTTTPFQFEVNGTQTGKALMSLNETGNQNILTGSASGTTQFNFDRTGNLAIEGQLSDLSQGTLVINDDVQINGNNILDSTGTTRINFNTGTNTNTITGTTFVLSGASTVTASSLTSLTTGAAFAIDGTSYVKIGDSTTPTNASGNDDLFVEGDVELDGILYADGGIILTGGTISDGTDGVDIADDLEIAGNTTFGDANTDTLTFNAEVAQDNDLVPDTTTGTNDLGSTTVPWDNIYVNAFYQGSTNINTIYAPIGASYITTAADATLTGETAIGALTTGISTTSTLNADGAVTLGGTTIDAGQNLVLAAGSGKLGVGNGSPVGKLDVSGAVTGKALSILNETGNQAILTGSASGQTRFTFDNSGNLSLEGAINDISGNLAINDNTDITGNVDLSGALTVGGSNEFNVTNVGVITTVTNETLNGIDINAGTVSDVVNLTINSGGTLTIDTTALNETTSPTDSGAYLIGVNDEFANSANTNLQAVLNDLDAAISGSTSKWTTNSNVIYPTTNGSQVALGTGITTTPFQFEVNGKQTGKALAVLNETGNQAILSGSASGQTRFTFDNSGNLAIEGQLSDISGTTLAINDDLQVVGNDIMGSGGSSVINFNAGNNTITGTTLTLSTTTTLDATSLTAINGGATAINFTNYTVAAATGSVNISGSGGTLTVDQTILDSDSLTFIGSGLIATAGSNNLTLAPATGYVRVGDTATPGVGKADGDDDLFIEGDVELDGTLFADGNVTIGGSTITASSLTTFTTGALSLNATGNLTLDSTLDVILDADGADVIFRDGGAAYATFTNSTTDLTLDVAGGQLLLANGDVFNIGGLTGATYNAISDSAATSRSLSTDNDLFVEGDVEVDGTFYFDGPIRVNNVLGADVTASCVTTDNGIVTGATACEPGADSWTASSTTGVLHTSNQTMDVLFGGVSTSSAVFKVSPRGTSPVASVSGNTSYASMVVNNNGLGDLFTASKSGKTHFTIRNSGAVVIGNSTNGITFDANVPADTVYTGSARPTKQIVLSAEYAGATLTASGSASNNTGTMTADASSSATTTPYYMNYYEWSSTTSTPLQSYIVAVKITLPQDFGAWATSNALQIYYNTELTNNGSNKLDVILLNKTSSLTGAQSSTPVVYRQNLSSTSKVWTPLNVDVSDLTDAGFGFDAAGETAVLYLKMYSMNNNHVQVGDIILNYLGRN